MVQAVHRAAAWQMLRQSDVRMQGSGIVVAADWRTKPTDRFILKWIKLHLSAHVTRLLVRVPWVRPAAVTVVSAGLAVAGGVALALGWGWLAAVLASCSQVLDGADGQLARLSGSQSRGGAYLDSVLDRYGDSAMVLGLVVYSLRFGPLVPAWAIVALGFLALGGSSSISYSSARAAELGMDMGRPTLASKGTRTTVMVVGAAGTLVWPPLGTVALAYLAIHTNVVVCGRMLRASRCTDDPQETGPR